MTTKNISAGLAQVQFGYQNAFTAAASHNQASIDRARGGIIKIKITIPELTVRTNSKKDSVTLPERICEFDIDLELLPLVNTSGYAVDREQNSPDRMAYPYGRDAADDATPVPFGGAFG